MRGYFAIIKGAFAHRLLHLDTTEMHTWEMLLPNEDDICAVAHEALRHRIHLAPGARASGWDADRIIDELLALTGLSA